jgi:hypothetical protein
MIWTNRKLALTGVAISFAVAVLMGIYGDWFFADANTNDIVERVQRIEALGNPGEVRHHIRVFRRAGFSDKEILLCLVGWFASCTRGIAPPASSVEMVHGLDQKAK